MRLHPFFYKALRWQVDGSQINFWFDNWIFQHPLKDLVDLIPGSHHLKVSEFIISGGIWDRAKLEIFLPSRLVSRISSLFLPSHPPEDVLVQGLSADGKYSVKSGALLAQGLTEDRVPKVAYVWIWKLRVPPKVKNFLWKACNDGFPTKSRLKKAMFFPQECVLCNYHT